MVFFFEVVFKLVKFFVKQVGYFDQVAIYIIQVSLVDYFAIKLCQKLCLRRDIKVKLYICICFKRG
jgi:hypothetical protein